MPSPEFDEAADELLNFVLVTARKPPDVQALQFESTKIKFRQLLAEAIGAYPIFGRDK
jgi:hypothetical protein